MRVAGLCVPLTPKKLDDIFAAELAGADLVEVRLDYLKNPQESIHTRWDRLPLPVIATCRGKQRGGEFNGSIEEETRILESAAQNGAKFVDIDYRFAKPVAGAEVIGSFHDFAGTPTDVDAILERACASPAQIGKVATMVNSWSDNRRLLTMSERSWPKPVIVAGMGEIGQITRVLALARGSFLTYGALGQGSAPGQIAVRDMHDVYRFKRVKKSTGIIGIIGNPLGHSQSPLIHNRAFELLSLDFAFVKCPTTDVKDFFDNARAIGIEGFCVTIPHKSTVIPFLAEHTPEAKEAGAVNTVVWRDGHWIGDNTDIHGIHASLRSVSFDPTGKTVTILGAGGASKAAVVAVKGAKKINVLPRSEVPKAQNYPCDLLINATPIGMYPNVDVSPVEGAIPAGVVFDMVYNPAITRLLRSAADQGKTIIQGTTMFLAQAARQFEIWTGHRAPAEVFEAKLHS
jgi:3-dehydroquinate dehydratase / shikimate dehydrogenase